MEYREVGKTGCKAGIIGLGCENLDNKPFGEVESTIKTAVDCGVNIFDVFMPGREVRENIMKALGGRRSEVLIQGHIGSTDVNQQYDISRDLPTVKKYFEDMLRIFGYIDFGMLFFIDSEDDYKNVFETGFADYALKLKESGDIRHIGFSSHNPLTALRAVKTGLPEMMMFSINLAFDLSPAEADVLGGMDSGFGQSAFDGLDPARMELYRYCEEHGVGITVMKALGAGKLISPEHTPFVSPMTVPQCLHYALTRPAVASVMLGAKSQSEVTGALDYLTLSDSERDYTHLLGTQVGDFRGKCVYCSHCQPCPAGIDIAAVNKYLDIAKLGGEVAPSISSHYKSLKSSGADCTSCGSCEERCPFSVKIIENMAEAARLFN